MTLIPLLSDSLFPLLAVSSKPAECACVPRRCVYDVSVPAPRALHASALRASSGACVPLCHVRHMHAPSTCVCLSAVCTAMRACLGAACVACVTCVSSAPGCASRVCVPRCRVRHVRASAPQGHVRACSVPRARRACPRPACAYICRCLGATCVACVRPCARACGVSASAPGMSMCVHSSVRSITCVRISAPRASRACIPRCCVRVCPGAACVPRCDVCAHLGTLCVPCVPASSCVSGMRVSVLCASLACLLCPMCVTCVCVCLGAACMLALVLHVSCGCLSRQFTCVACVARCHIRHVLCVLGLHVCLPWRRVCLPWHYMRCMHARCHGVLCMLMPQCQCTRVHACLGTVCVACVSSSGLGACVACRMMFGRRAFWAFCEQVPSFLRCRLPSLF